MRRELEDEFPRHGPSKVRKEILSLFKTKKLCGDLPMSHLAVICGRPN